MIVKAEIQDARAAAELAADLWGHGPGELAEELAALIAGGDGAVFLAVEGGTPVGFAQCQLRRDYVEGTESSPVGYLEGIYVRNEYRRQGLASALLGRCEDWARQRGCTEFASDCELENLGSLGFHLKMGFAEANRIICFTKKLGREEKT